MAKRIFNAGDRARIAKRKNIEDFSLRTSSSASLIHDHMPVINSGEDLLSFMTPVGAVISNVMVYVEDSSGPVLLDLLIEGEGKSERKKILVVKGYNSIGDSYDLGARDRISISVNISSKKPGEPAIAKDVWISMLYSSKVIRRAEQG